VWKAPLRVQANLRVLKTMVEFSFYTSETWPLTLRREQRPFV
jgi:hypothetical protein